MPAGFSNMEVIGYLIENSLCGIVSGEAFEWAEEKLRGEKAEAELFFFF